MSQEGSPRSDWEVPERSSSAMLNTVPCVLELRRMKAHDQNEKC